MTSRELYKMLRPVLDRAQFEFDDDRLNITVKIPIRPEDVAGFDDAMWRLLDDGHAIRPKTPTGYRPRKIRTELIKYDGDTIKTDKYDQLYVDGDEVLDKESVQEKIREICREEIAKALRGTSLEGIKEMLDELVISNLLKGIIFDPHSFKVWKNRLGEAIFVSLIHKHHFPGPVFPGYEEFYKVHGKKMQFPPPPWPGQKGTGGTKLKEDSTEEPIGEPQVNDPDEENKEIEP